MLERLFTACLVRPADLSPTNESLEVVGAFNPGAADLDGEVVVFVRVAEAVRERRQGHTGLPRWDPDTGFVIDWLPNDAITVIDPRIVMVNATGLVRLTFISHLRVVRSSDGRTVHSVTGLRFDPGTQEEEYGVEDPRITRIGDTYYISYVAVSRHGAATALASTRDFETFDRHGIIFPCENKDVVLFPERIKGEYAAFHRPNPATHFSQPEMWLAWSPDLMHWGRHEPFHGGSGDWETGRIGAGVPPFRSPDGWVEIYHGNDKAPGDTGVGRYSAGALLLDPENPQHILGRTQEPIMVPEADFEREGFVADVIFPTALVERGDSLLLYYGAADACTGVVEFSRSSLLDAVR
jgi:beta-1,2-mannobiose phosphorylase / 1,2-beta-oligomannan phosphorylase